MANQTIMTYGDYQFSPVPFINVTKEYNTTEDGQHLSATYNLTLTGTLTPLGTPQATAGYKRVDALQDELREAFAVDGGRLRVECNGNEIMECYPTVKSITFDTSNDNWVFTTPFTIELQYHAEPWDNDDDVDNFDASGTGLFGAISTYSDSWDIEFVPENGKYEWNLSDGLDASPWVLRLTRNLNATGLRRFVPDANPASGVVETQAWEEARSFVAGKLLLENEVAPGENSEDWKERFGNMYVHSWDMDVDQFERFNHVRTINIDETAGSYGVTETWLVMNPSGDGVNGRATEDFTVTVANSATAGLTTITVEGTIQGLEERNYGNTTALTPNSNDHIVEFAYNNASGYWSEVSGRLYNRAVFAAETLSPNLNADALTSSVGHNPSKGVITYSYTYDNRPCNFISGALSENITISEDNPTDMFASLFVLGRAKGPILQDLGTISAATRSASIEVVMAPPTGCDGCSDVNLMLAAAPGEAVDEFLCCLETQLESVWDQVYKSTDSESWNPKSGLYTRNVSWTMSQCTNDPVSTSFC